MDYTTMVGLVINRDETNYGSEVSHLATWYSDNNLSLNMKKTKEIVMDFRKPHAQHAPLTINCATVESVSSAKFLGVHVPQEQEHHISGQKGSAESLLPLHTEKSWSYGPIMCTFFRGIIESALTGCITVQYCAYTTSCRKTLQRIVRATAKFVDASLPSLDNI